MTGLFSKAALRMEMVAFQNDKFGQDLEEIVGRIRGFVERGMEDFGIQKLPEIRQMEDLIFSRLKMKVNISTMMSLAAIIPFHLNENSVLMNPVLKSMSFPVDQVILRKDNWNFKGTVDEEKAQLGGDFSKMSMNLFMNFSQLFGMYNLSVRQVVGVLMHELGHGFYACVYTNQMDTVNTIVSDVLRKIDPKKGMETVEVVRQDLAHKGIKVPDDTLKDLTSKNPIVMTKVAAKLVGEVSYSQMLSGKYAETNFEQLADNFAARFGYGYDTLMGLEKLMPGGIKYHYITMLSVSFSQALRIAYKIVDLIAAKSYIDVLMKNQFYLAGIQAIVNTIMAAFVLTLTMVIIINSSGESGRDATYDDLVQRYNRMRNQLVEAIKSGVYTKQQAKAIVKQYEDLGVLIKDVKPYRGPLDFMFNTFNPKDRNAKSAIDRQQAIENMISNPLFISAEKLEQALK